MICMKKTKIRLRTTDAALIGLPWDLPISAWQSALFAPVQIGPSRNIVRFFDGDEGRYALKELESSWADREWRVLRRCADAGVPAVAPVGIIERPDGYSIVITRAIHGVDSYRELLTNDRSGDDLESLLDAMALLLVELHRAGIYWGDASLANTLLARDGDGMIALLVDGETGEVHLSGLSDGQREQDLLLCVDRVAHGLADLAAAAGLEQDARAISLAESVPVRYRAIWSELTAETRVDAGDMHAVVSRVRAVEQLGFTVREINLRPDGERVRLSVRTGRRRALGERLERLTGVRALEGQARIILDDLAVHRAWLSSLRGHEVGLDAAGVHWRAERFEPALARLAGRAADPIQAYCEVIEDKWLASERAGHDIGLRAALEAWLARKSE